MMDFDQSQHQQKFFSFLQPDDSTVMVESKDSSFSNTNSERQISNVSNKRVKPKAVVTIEALMFHWRRVAVAYVGLPICLWVFPLTLAVVYAVLQTLSKGYAVLSLLSGAVLTLYARDSIHKCAPTKDDATAAIKNSRLIIPLLSTTVGALCLNVLVRLHLLRRTYTVNYNEYIYMSMQMGNRLGAFALVSNMMVAIRFFGPFTIVKFSNGPLQMNPRTRFISKMKSLDSFFDSLTSLSSSAILQSYQQPKTSVIFLQIIIHAALGWVLGFLVTSTLGSFDPLTFAFTCVLNIVFCFTMTKEGGKQWFAHELDITYFQIIDKKNAYASVIFGWLCSQTSNFILNTANATLYLGLVCISNLILLSLSPIEKMRMGTILLTATFSVCSNMACFVYLSTSDLFHRFLLSQPASTASIVKNTVQQNHKHEQYTTLFCIRAILQDEPICLEILKYSQVVSNENNSFTPYIKSHNNYSFKAQYSMLQKHYFHQVERQSDILMHQYGTEVNFSEQMLRIHVTTDPLLPLRFKLKSNQSEEEHGNTVSHMMCVLQALLVYCGSIGGLLLKSEKQLKPKENTNEKHKMTEYDVWLPPGAVTQVNFAVKHIHTILFKPPKLFSASTFYHSHTSIFHPVVLQALFVLHKGLLSYVEQRMMIDKDMGLRHAVVVYAGDESKENKLKRVLAVQYPEIQSITMLCQSLSSSLCKEESVKGEWKQWDLLSAECKKWLNSLSS